LSRIRATAFASFRKYSFDRSPRWSRENGQGSGSIATVSRRTPEKSET
jgi:hypothetical protein